MALAALMFCLAAPVAARGQEPTERVPPVVDELVQNQVFLLLTTSPEEGPLDRAALREELLLLGAPLGPVAAGILCAEIEVPGTVFGTEDSRVSPELLEIRDGLLRECLLGLDARGVVDHLARRASPDAPLEVRLCASRLLGDISDPGVLKVLIGIARGIDPVHLQRPYVRVVLETALAARMADGIKFSKLQGYAAGCRVELSVLLVRAAARAATPATRRFLVSQMDRNEDIQKIVLREIAANRDVDAYSLDPSDMNDLRSKLYSDDGELRRLAALALGRLEDPGSVAALVKLLGSRDPLEAAAAHEALRSITRSDLGTQAAAWNRWLSGEESWWKKTAATELARFSKAGGREQYQALQALLRHPLYRNEMALEMVYWLREGNTATALMVCRALGGLGSHLAVPELIEVLTDPNEELRAAAQQALRSLSRWNPTLGELLAARDVGQ